MGESSQSSESVQALWRVPQWFPNLSGDIQNTLKLFHVELLQFNAKVNLIGRGTERDADEAHFADSIMGSQLLINHCKFKEIYDVGSGNGLPGIAIGILAPKMTVKLVEKDMRKCEFLKQIIFRLKLANISVVNTRFEDLEHGSLDAAVSRGLGTISRTLLSGNRCFHKDSCYYHFKSTTWSTEIAAIPSQVCAVWKPELVGEYALPHTQARRAVVVTRKMVD